MSSVESIEDGDLSEPVRTRDTPDDETGDVFVAFDEKVAQLRHDIDQATEQVVALVDQRNELKEALVKLYEAYQWSRWVLNSDASTLQARQRLQKAAAHARNVIDRT